MVYWRGTVTTMPTPNAVAVGAAAAVDRAAMTGADGVGVGVGGMAARVAPARVAPAPVARATTIRSSATSRPAARIQHLYFAPGGRAVRTSAGGFKAPLPQSLRWVGDQSDRALRGAGVQS